MTLDRTTHKPKARTRGGLAAVAVAIVVLFSFAGSVDAQTASPEGFSLRHIPESQPLMGSQQPARAAFTEEVGTVEVKELSATRAVLYSLLLPGLGDWYAGQTHRAKTFFVIDAAIWTTFIVFQVQGHNREDSYQQHAQQFAGVASTDHSTDYWDTIGDFDSSDDYESDFKKESRLETWPDVGYDALEAFYVENRVSDFESWAWQSFDNRVEYLQLQSGSKLSYRRSGYMLAVAALNRVIASVFAWHAVKSSRGEFDDDAGETSGYHFDFSTPPFGARGGYAATVSLVRSF